MRWKQIRHWRGKISEQVKISEDECHPEWESYIGGGLELLLKGIRWRSMANPEPFWRGNETKLS